MSQGVLVCGILINVLVGLFSGAARELLFWITSALVFFVNLAVLVSSMTNGLPTAAPQYFWPFIITIVWVVYVVASKALDWMDLRSRTELARDHEMEIRRAVRNFGLARKRVEAIGSDHSL